MNLSTDEFGFINHYKSKPLVSKSPLFFHKSNRYEVMQITILPQKVCQYIDRLSCHFLWGDTNGSKGCHTVNWDTVTLPKEAGGLGITSTRHRNQAILMNQAWRLYSTPSSLWARILKAKYFPQATLFTGPRSARRSHIWTAISLGAELLREGL